MVKCNIGTATVDYLMDQEVILEDPEFVCLRGSLTHGLYQQGDCSDVDLISCYVAGRRHYLGFPRDRHHGGRDRWHEQYDVVNYELRHLVKLLSGCNPNVYPLLHVDLGAFIRAKRWVLQLRDQKDLFFDTKLIRDSYYGYARGQYERLKKDPRNFDEIKRLEELDKKDRGALNTAEREEYDQLKEKYWSGWMGKKRKQKVLKYGFDPKWAVHTIRLLRNGRELLETGEMRVDRTGIDREELLEVKSGRFGFEEICDRIEGEFEEFERVAEEVDKREKDEEGIEEFLIGIVERKIN